MLEIYTAGFLDADGSLSLQKERKDKPDWMRTPEVSFYNCDFTILKIIQDKWGGTIKTRQVKNKNHNISYELRVIDNKALSLLCDVLPYMLHSKKKERAQLIVSHYKENTPRNGKYTIEQIEKKIWLTDKVMGINMRGNNAY